ncbi:MAG TPA: protein-signal peptide and transmembrane prediction, partial [Gemmataceae bacterium]|nr:protein-signal peptide and transmembrane prediction [Gemmataceae bacterium]
MNSSVTNSLPWRLAALAAVGLSLIAAPTRADGPKPAEKKLPLRLRTRTETAPGSGRYHALTRPVKWDAAKTAVVICDMWDRHWCPGATARVAEMAPRVNDFVAAARRRGALVLHCPSDTMNFYKDTPQRRLAQSAPKVEPKVPLQNWCRLDPKKEGPLPIDDSDGGCAEGAKSCKAWSRQIDTIRIEPGDAVTDSAEAYYLMRQRGIENVLVMGVHTNMCVLGRPFAIRQLVAQGLNVALVRDLTDTMYNPAKAPFVSHFTGTDLVVEHIEKHWCPTCTSADLLGGKEFRFKEDKRPHL